MNPRNLGGLAVLLAGATFLVAVLVYRFGPEPADMAKLRQAPHVVRVEAPIRLRSPQRRIIHILDYLLVPGEMHEGPEPYEEHLANVRAVQEEQRDLLRHLVEEFRLKAVYLEGLTAETVAPYQEKVAVLKAMEREEIPALRTQLSEAQALKSPAARQIEKEINALLNAHLLRVREVGAPGQLLMTGILEKVWPLDDAGPLAAADPRKADAKTMKARDDAIVRNALKGGEPIAVVVLGARHDLTESIRAADPHCGYIRVTTGKVSELVGER